MTTVKNSLHNHGAIYRYELLLTRGPIFCINVQYLRFLNKYNFEKPNFLQCTLGFCFVQTLSASLWSANNFYHNLLQKIMFRKEVF